MNLKKLVTLLFLFEITSCGVASIPGKVTAFPLTNFKVPDGTPAFQAGYKVGCSAVMYARGNVFYRSRNDYNYDPKMIGVKDYRTGYSRGWAWCFNNIANLNMGGGANGSIDLGLFPAGHPFDSSPSTVDEAWGGFFETPAPNIIEIGSGLDGSFSVWQKGKSGGTALGGNPIWSGGGSSGLSFMGIW